MRLSSQRGVSLLLLIIAITVFAGVAIGIVTLLRSRYESYPYQVQSYQAYTLAHAGVEFAIRYAMDNNVNPNDANSFFNKPTMYIPAYPNYQDFTFGNGKFSLSYKSGCPDALYSKGTYGTATREVQLSNFSLYLGAQGNGLYIIAGGIKRTCYGTNCAAHTCWNGSYYTCADDPDHGPYSGNRIQISYCNTNAQSSMVVLLASGTAPVGTIAARSIDVPAQQVTLGRLGFMDITVPPTDNPLQVWWTWDGTCGITGPASQGVNPYCPGAYVQGGDHCPNTTVPPYNGLGLVDCVSGGASPQFLFPPLSWNNYPTTPPTPGYPFFWNTDTEGWSSTQYDATCRPIRPCDPNGADNGTDGPTCVARNQCAVDAIFCWQSSQPWPPGNPVAYGNHYSCFDDAQSCWMGYGTPTERSRATCHYPMGSWPGGTPNPAHNVALHVDLNRLTIETIGYLDAIVGTNGVKFYVSFNTSLGTTVLTFTVH